jgi:hypothetical protein
MRRDVKESVSEKDRDNNKGCEGEVAMVHIVNAYEMRWFLLWKNRQKSTKEKRMEALEGNGGRFRKWGGD